MKKKKFYAVQKISDQVQQNFDAWAKTVSVHENEQEAEAEADSLYHEDRDSLPSGEGYVLGYSYRVVKFSK